MNSLSLKEYEKITAKECCDLDLPKFQQYLERQKLEKALKITPNGISSKSYVGIIKFQNTQIEILPKLISESQDSEIILKNLIYMLSYTKKLDIKTSETAFVSKCENPFLEVLIREFAQSLLNCLKRLSPKNYVREEDNLNYLRGKLKFSENIKYNCINQAKFYCEYDEFSENNILNQLFLFVSHCLFSVSRDSNNKKVLKQIINYFSDINFVRIDKFKVNKIILSRNQKLFEKPFKIAKMFIENSSIDLSKNDLENITLIWDMNKLFEEYVGEIVKRNFAKRKPITQKGKFLLSKKKNFHRMTYADLILEKPRVIVDTKYKKLECLESVSNHDINQVGMYCMIHDSNEAILIYPQWNKPIREIYNINMISKDCKLKIASLNLKKDELKESDIVEELENIWRYNDEVSDENKTE